MDYPQELVEFDYSLLPEHIIINVLEYLPLADIKQVALTSKTWHAASLSRQISRKIGYRLGCHPKTDIEQINRPFSYLQLHKTDFNHFDHTNFLMKFQHYIIRIHFYECTVTLNQILECLVILENLESLEIDILYQNTMLELSPFVDANYTVLLKNLKKLKILTINGNSEGANFILSKCCNLDKLTYINQCLDAMIGDQVYEGMIGAMNQWTDGVNLNLLQIVDQRSASRITFLEIFGILPTIQLKCLDLSYFGYADNDFFENFYASLPNLQHLIVTILEYSNLYSICKLMTNLKKFTLKCVANDEMCNKIGIIGNLTNLEELVITAQDVPENELLELFNSKLCNLRTLHLHQMVLNQKPLTVLCENLKNLENLQITLIAGETQPIDKYLKLLKKVKINWCNKYEGNVDIVHGISECVDENPILQIPNFPFT